MTTGAYAFRIASSYGGFAVDVLAGCAKHSELWEMHDILFSNKSAEPTGNIGFHHIHHLTSRIPNYNLELCHDAEPLFQTVPPVTFFASLKSFTFRLWDEQQHKLVGFGALGSRKPSV